MERFHGLAACKFTELSVLELILSLNTEHLRHLCTETCASFKIVSLVKLSSITCIGCRLLKRGELSAVICIQNLVIGPETTEVILSAVRNK